MNKDEYIYILLFRNRGFLQAASVNSNFQTLKNVQNLRKTTPRYQKAGYGPGGDDDGSGSDCGSDDGDDDDDDDV